MSGAVRRVRCTGCPSRRRRLLALGVLLGTSCSLALAGCGDDSGGGGGLDAAWDAAEADARVPACGDGFLDEGEECDDGTRNSDTLPNRCRTDCTRPRCGDGVADTGEECDGSDLRGETCQDLGFDRGELRCDPNCRFDRSGCQGCGNGIREAGESCDGSDLGDLNCLVLGYDGGQLACREDCTLDTSQCYRNCGNGVLDEGESCDGTNLAGLTCRDFGLEDGTLRCRPDCTFDLTHCPGCGNGVAEEGEFCDGTDFKGVSCRGTLRCTQDCLLDASDCLLASAGDGGDGVLVVDDVVDVSWEDATSFPVVRMDGASVWVDGRPERGLFPGDEVIVAVLQGCPSTCNSVGRYEFGVVESVDATRIQLVGSLVTDFGLQPNGSVGCLRIVVQRVPHYLLVSVRPGGVLTVHPWDGRTGGLLVMRVAGDVVVDWGGAISVAGLGFRGGQALFVGEQSGWAGESLCGPGSQTTDPNIGGGGGGLFSGGTRDPCGQGGGGGAFGGPGAAPDFGDACRNAGNTSPAENGGQPYGDDTMSRLFLGSGGGSGATDDHSDTSGEGGRGGGALVLYASRLLLAGRILADGGDGCLGSDTDDSGNGGGGSGGAVWIRAGVIDGAGVVTARGGQGAPARDSWNNPGGDGGPGRIRVDFHHAWGFPFGHPEASAYVRAMCDPDPGVMALLIR